MKTMTKRMLLMFAFSLVVGAPSIASAGDLVAELRVVTSYATDPSLDAMTDEDDIASPQIGVGWGFEEFVPGLRGYFTYGVGGLTNSRLGGFASWDWSRHLFMAEAEWGPTFWGFVRPRGRLGVGYAMQYLELYSGISPPIHDYAHDLAVRPSGGVDVFLPLNWSSRANGLSVGLSMDVGYLWMTTATFDEMRYEDDAFVGEGENDPFARETADLGELDTTGVFWNVGLQGRLRF